MREIFRTPTAKLAVVLGLGVLVAFVLAAAVYGAFSARVYMSPLAESAWSLVEIDGATPAVGGEVTLTFILDPIDAGLGALSASGHSGVNSYFGKCSVGAGRALRFGSLGSTEMAGPPSLMDLEQRYLTALASVSRYEVTGTSGSEELRLYSGDTLRLRFIIAPVTD